MRSIRRLQRRGRARLRRAGASISSRKRRRGWVARAGSSASSIDRAQRLPERDAALARPARSISSSVLAPMPRGGHVEHAAQRDGVARVQHQAQVGEDVLHLLALVEADPAHHHVGDAAAQQRLLEQPALRVHAEEHGRAALARAGRRCAPPPRPPPRTRRRPGAGAPARPRALTARSVLPLRLPLWATRRRGRVEDGLASSGSSPPGAARARPGSRARSRGCCGCRRRARSRSTGPRRRPP